MAATEHDDNIKKLGELIKDIKIAMLTTSKADKTLHSRPMGTLQKEFDGILWFFTQSSAVKANEVRQDQYVNVSYSNPDDNLYVSVSGNGEIIYDKEKMKELWNPTLKIWFKDGLDDPDIALLKITVTQAEYWKASSSTIGSALAFVTAYVTGNDAALGENKKIDV